MKQLTEYRRDNQLFEICQSAYREHHSTETALTKIVNDMLLAMDSKQCVLLVLLDLSAAFDTVNHSVLLESLEEDFGINGAVLSWMDSYLTDRTQSVTVNGILSDPQPLAVGLPQGSIVGPGEFPTYTAPLFGIARDHGVSIHMYADDTQLYLPFNPKDYDNAKAAMESCLSDMRAWMANHHLKLNDQKTEFLVIGQKTYLKHLPQPCSITIGDSTISAGESAKNIGVYMDTELNMVTQVNHLSKSCYVHLRNIGRIRPNLTEDSAATLVHAFISSRLDCTNVLLYGLPDKVVKKLQTIQNNAARIVTRSNRYEHVTPLLRRLHWLPVRQRIKYKICLMTFKCLMGKAPAYLMEMLQPYIPSRALRSGTQGLLVERTARLKTVGDRAFQIAAPKLWNSLPSGLRQCDTLETFKTSLKTHLFREAFE